MNTYNQFSLHNEFTDATAGLLKPWFSLSAVGHEVGLILFVFDCQHGHGYVKRLHLRQDAMGVFLKSGSGRM